jgi:hypothetical protein
MFEVCFEKQNVRIAPSRWLFAKRQAMRFEWLALLAFRKAAASSENAWVTLDDIARLPSWSGKTHHHIATNVGRYPHGDCRDGDHRHNCRPNRHKLLFQGGRWTGRQRQSRNPKFNCI